MPKTPTDDPYYDRLRSFLEATSNETDRGRTLVAASLIDEMLEEILKSYLSDTKQTKKLFEMPNAPLSSLSAKALLCRSLQLITEPEYRDIELVRKIRNRFAHSVLCSFNDPKIKDWGRKLELGMAMIDQLEAGHNSRVDDAKGRFSMVTTSIVSALYNRSYYVKEIKVTMRKFPE